MKKPEGAAEEQGSEAAVVSLDDRRAAKFLNKLADEPHLTIFVSTDGEVSIWSSGIEPDHLARIKEVLEEIQQEGD